VRESKVKSSGECISEIPDGASILIGGWGPIRKPMVLLKELLKSSIKDLTIMTYGGMDLDLLLGAGKVKKAIYGFVSFEGAPGSPGNFRRARQDNTVEMRELSEYLFICGLKAAAERLPFYPTRSGLGTDIITVNPEMKMIEDPYTGEKLIAMPAMTPDIALIHVNEADHLGNGRILGDPFLDRLFVRAAKKTILSAEKILPPGSIQNSTILSPWVDVVVEAPGGAWPGSCYPDYEIDEKEFKRYGEAAATLESFQKYLSECCQGG
jgi:glutaconate CoA-transferase subunit A